MIISFESFYFKIYWILFVLNYLMDQLRHDVQAIFLQHHTIWFLKPHILVNDNKTKTKTRFYNNKINV